MSELLKRADNFNSLSDGISEKNPADTKLVTDLAYRIRELESKSYAKRIATGFSRWWWNTSGTNTNQGFDTYWGKLLDNELELPSKYAVEGVTEEDVHETKFPPALDTIPVDHGRDADRRFHQLRRGNRMRNGILSTTMTRDVPEVECDVPEVKKANSFREYKTVTLENLQKDWLSGTTCHRQKRTVHWVSDDGQWIVMKHHGHSEWVGGWDGNAYCGTRYDLFRVGDEFPRTIDQSRYFTQESRWSKASTEWVEKVMAGWRPDNFVENR